MSSTLRTYAIAPSYSLSSRAPGARVLRDADEARRRALFFHIEANDYFGTLATIIGLMIDLYERGDAQTREQCHATLSALQEELMYLQKTHRIVRR